MLEYDLVDESFILGKLQMAALKSVLVVEDLLAQHDIGQLKCDQVLYKPFTRVDIVQSLPLFQAK